MDRFHLYLRALIGTLAVSLAACGADEVEIPAQLIGEPACIWVIDTHGHYADGRTRVLTDEQGWWGTGAACLCLTEDEFETESRHDELNDMALDVCNHLVTQFDFDWDECQMDHDSERWLDFVFWSAGRYSRPEGDALSCAGESP